MNMCGYCDPARRGQVYMSIDHEDHSPMWTRPLSSIANATPIHPHLRLSFFADFLGSNLSLHFPIRTDSSVTR